MDTEMLETMDTGQTVSLPVKTSKGIVDLTKAVPTGQTVSLPVKTSKGIVDLTRAVPTKMSTSANSNANQPPKE